MRFGFKWFKTGASDKLIYRDNDASDYTKDKEFFIIWFSRKLCFTEILICRPMCQR